MADYTGIWKYLFDWQTLIAGLVAFGGAGLAYWGALTAADRQVQAIREQMKQEREATAERERRERKRLVEGLSIEAARIRELASERFATAREEYVRQAGGPDKPAEVRVDRARAYMIGAGALRAGDPTLLGRKLWNAAGEVAAKIDMLNSAIEVDGALGRLKGTELIRRLERVHEFAGRLQGTLALDRMVRDD